MRMTTGIFGLISLEPPWQACVPPSLENAADPAKEESGPAPRIAANLVFFYYRGPGRAQRFYEGTLGLERILDTGFASIHRPPARPPISGCRRKAGHAQGRRAKTVTLSFVTGEVDGWHDHLSGRGVPIRNPLREATRHPTRGFVATDRKATSSSLKPFLDHPQNKSLREKLADVSPLYPQPVRKTAEAGRPASLGVQATVFWLYYKDVPAAQRFYETAMGQTLLVDQGFAKVYSSSGAGFIGLVDEAQGLHRFSEGKAVNVAFMTPDLEAWQERMKAGGAVIRERSDGGGRTGPGFYPGSTRRLFPRVQLVCPGPGEQEAPRARQIATLSSRSSERRQDAVEIAPRPFSPRKLSPSTMSSPRDQTWTIFSSHRDSLVSRPIAAM